MRIAFLTEMGFMGKVPANHPNMRTEFAWMYALDADHFNIHMLDELKGYEHVFVIFPKGKTFLSSEGSTLVNGVNPVSQLLREDIVGKIKQQGNINVHYVQEGPHWWYNDYEIADQIYFYNFLQSCDSIFTHNESEYRVVLHHTVSNTILKLYKLHSSNENVDDFSLLQNHVHVELHRIFCNRVVHQYVSPLLKCNQQTIHRLFENVLSLHQYKLLYQGRMYQEMQPLHLCQFLFSCLQLK